MYINLFSHNELTSNLMLLIFIYITISFSPNPFISIALSISVYAYQFLYISAFLISLSLIQTISIYHVRCLNDFQLIMGLYRGLPLFFFECVYLSLLYPSLIFDIFSSLCICVCIGVVLDFTNSYFSSVCECASWGFFSVCMHGSGNVLHSLSLYQ